MTRTKQLRPILSHFLPNDRSFWSRSRRLVTFFTSRPWNPKHARSLRISRCTCNAKLQFWVRNSEPLKILTSVESLDGLVNILRPHSQYIFVQTNKIIKINEHFRCHEYVHLPKLSRLILTLDSPNWSNLRIYNIILLQTWDSLFLEI